MKALLKAFSAALCQRFWPTRAFPKGASIYDDRKIFGFSDHKWKAPKLVIVQIVVYARRLRVSDDGKQSPPLQSQEGVRVVISKKQLLRCINISTRGVAKLGNHATS